MSFCMRCDKPDCTNCTYVREGWRELEELQAQGVVRITDILSQPAEVPICPICGYLIYPAIEGNKWRCFQCGTVWSTVDLIAAIQEL